ncbi:MAG: citrate/2-methylcitrate synthase [Gammaproteobacteria bacterium]|nr:MAG: citrate/2-methylcitrate synthase [Gammaproteobacteria bacterium]
MSTLHLGLEGIAVAESKISSVNGEKGELIYRGYWAEELVRDHCLEEIVYLLWYGDLPNPEQSKTFKAVLAEKRALPDYIKKIIDTLPKTMPPMSVLRTAISALQVPGESWPPTIEQAMEIFAKAPTIVAYYYNFIHSKPQHEPDKNLGHTANYLYMLQDEKPTAVKVKALDTYLMLSLDHDINASTFTARVVTSTRSDIVSAITAAIGALIGPLHGGAPSKVDDMLDAIGSKENAEKWIREQLEKGERLMGFGHRVYKTYDPRAAALRHLTQEIADYDLLLQLSLDVEKIAVPLLEEYKPGRKLYPNVEFWAAAIMRTVKLPRELYTPTFCISRIAGWSGQIIEQAENNRLIRPSCIYIGKRPTTPSHHQ